MPSPPTRPSSPAARSAVPVGAPQPHRGARLRGPVERALGRRCPAAGQYERAGFRDDEIGEGRVVGVGGDPQVRLRRDPSVRSSANASATLPASCMCASASVSVGPRTSARYGSIGTATRSARPCLAADVMTATPGMAVLTSGQPERLTTVIVEPQVRRRFL